MASAVKKTTVTKVVSSEGVQHQVPEFIKTINDDYKSKIAHVFIIHGNINDYCDNSGVRQPIHKTLATAMDDNVEREMRGGVVSDKGGRGLQDEKELKVNRRVTRILATFNLSSGLEFAHPNSHKSWVDAMKAYYGEQVENWPAGWDKPNQIENCCLVLQRWFQANKEIQRANELKLMDNLAPQPELLLTVLFTDGDSTFPQGDISQLYADRPQIVHIRNWARDEQLGNRNRIIIMTRHLSDIHDSLRGGGCGISTILIAKPTIVDREEWLKNFSASIEQKVTAKGKPMMIGSNEVTKVNLAEGFDLHQFAVQSAGMSRRQMEFVIMKSWLTGEAIDFRLVREQKQRALEDEYQGLVEFFEPEYGFEQIGGHEHLKKYFRRKVIIPLQQGNTRLCTRGMLMTGPPGTGKTVIAKALAKEAKMNFMIGHLDRLFGGLVGETEQKTRKFLEAVDSAAPCIVFLDEMDSVLSSGRQSAGDSGTSGRVFNALMTWLSDESRAGRVVVIGASNRPDLLDSALIRSGRIDAKVPALPPQKGDAKGRISILAALLRKHNVKFAKEVAATENTENNGLGRLLHDNKRVWTGAEIEVVLKEALDNAAFAERVKDGKPDYAMTIEDWNKAMDEIIPNTEEVERMTKLSLVYVDHLGYCPPEWRELASDKARLRAELGLKSKGGIELEED